jgi:2-oxoglutarate ferredoxin oxidoreductase subunit gamma
MEFSGKDQEDGLAMKERLEIVASGFGGQGVVRLGQVLGEAAVKQGLHVTMLKSHGTEMRGGYVRSQVVLSEDIIDSPMCENPDVLVTLSSAAYERFKGTVPENGSAMAKLLEKDLSKEIILESILVVLPKFKEENKKAFQIGFDSF